MTDITDLLLIRPLAANWALFLQFTIFYIHLTLVLILIGHAAIGIMQMWSESFAERIDEPPWSHVILERWLAPKALGVGFGVGVLLVTQLYDSVPFYTAIAMFGGFWISAIYVMIVAFLAIEWATHKAHEYHTASLVVGTFGLMLLLYVPAVFVLILTTTENSSHWVAIANRRYGLDVDLVLHWLTRYLHIIGAAIVFGAAFQLLFTVKGVTDRRRVVVRWMITGLLVQFVTGGTLAITLQQWIRLWVLIPLAVGITAAGVALWMLAVRSAEPLLAERRVRAVPYVLLVLLGGMLLTRQFIQQQKVLPVLQAAEANAEAYGKELASLEPAALGAYQAQLTNVYDNGKTIFEQSCSFCHGLDGSGNAPDGLKLLIRPERIAEIRASRAYFDYILPRGVPGAAMPYFTIFDQWKRDALVNHLDERFGVLGRPDPPPVPISEARKTEAERYYGAVCSKCHGQDGKGSQYAHENFAPAVPDFTWFGLTPEREMEVLRKGYPGTAMQPFDELDEELRWALVAKIQSFRQE